MTSRLQAAYDAFKALGNIERDNTTRNAADALLDGASTLIEQAMQELSPVEWPKCCPVCGWLELEHRMRGFQILTISTDGETGDIVNESRNSTDCDEDHTDGAPEWHCPNPACDLWFVLSPEMLEMIEQKMQAEGRARAHQPDAATQTGMYDLEG